MPGACSARRRTSPARAAERNSGRAWGGERKGIYKMHIIRYLEISGAQWSLIMASPIA